MPPSKNRPVDLINDPIKLAGDMAYQQVERFLVLNNNPPGTLGAGQRPPRMTQAELRRLMGKE